MLDITKALLHAVGRIQPLALLKRINLRLDCPKGLPHSTGKALQVERLLDALFTHAIKVSASGSVVRVVAGVMPHGVDGIGDSVAIVVTDTGAGIRRRGFDRLLRAFRPLHILEMHVGRREPPALSLTCRLGGLEGGRLWVKSRVGNGSIFAAVLPVSGRRPEQRLAQ